MSKLTKFKVRRSQFPLDFRIDNTTRDTNIKTLVAMPGTVFEEGTEETAETYNGLQLGLVHSVIPVKSVANSIDYYTCDIEGIADFGMHNELKLQMKITSTNEYDQPKIKMNGNNYQIMRFDGVQLTQVLAGQLKTDNIYNLSFNGTLFILSSGMIAEKEVKALLDTTDFQATETVAGIVKIATQSEINAGVDDTKIITSKKLASMLNSTYIKNTDLADVTIRNQWKVIFDGGFGVQGGVVATLPGDWSDCLVYYGVYSATENRIDNSSMLITSSEKGGRNMVHYSGTDRPNHEIKINVNNINQVVLVDRGNGGDAVINKVLYKNNR